MLGETRNRHYGQEHYAWWIYYLHEFMTWRNAFGRIWNQKTFWEVGLDWEWLESWMESWPGFTIAHHEFMMYMESRIKKMSQALAGTLTCILCRGFTLRRIFLNTSATSVFHCYSFCSLRRAMCSRKELRTKIWIEWSHWSMGCSEYSWWEASLSKWGRWR